MLLPLPYIQETLGDEATILFQSFSWSFAASCVLLVLWRGLIAPVVAANRSADDLVFLTNSVVSLFPALTAPFLAVQALWELPISDHATALAAAPTPLALRAVGLSCGYMAYDTVFCLAHKQVRHPLLLGHHLLSILFFPYATLRHRALLVVLFFVCTEVTNIGQHVRIILLKLGHERSRLYLVNGVAWAVSFFVVRILPSPYLFYKMADCSYAAFSRADFVVAWATMPIPFVLNSFWFYLLASGVLRFLRTHALPRCGTPRRRHPAAGLARRCEPRLPPPRVSRLQLSVSNPQAADRRAPLLRKSAAAAAAGQSREAAVADSRSSHAEA